MSATYHGITASAITWSQTESEIERSETGEATIRCLGHVEAGDTPTALENAEALIPDQIPISNSGPIGNSSAYTGAKYTSHSVRYSDESTIQISVVYKKAIVVTTADPDGTVTSPSDRAQRSVAVEDVPILTHPVVSEFPASEVQKLRSLLSGDAYANPAYKVDGNADQQRKFLQVKEENEVEVLFDDTTATSDSITASPLDFARMIASGVDTYRCPRVRHSVSVTRESPASNAEYGKVGEVVSSPSLAPTLSGGQWFLDAIIDATDNGTTWQTNYEWTYSGFGGVMKYLYKGGKKELI